MYAGEGNDSVEGGDGGDDTIAGGAGDDNMYGNAGADVFIIRDADTTGGTQTDTIQDFSVSEDALAFDMAEISTFQDMMDRATASGSDTSITFDDGSTVRVRWVQPNELSSSNFQTTSTPVCLARGTRIATTQGDAAVENLKVGDMIFTRDRGPQPLRAMTCQTLVFRDRQDRAKPVLIRAGALGPTRPRHDLMLSPQHRVLCDLYGTEHLVPAHRLTASRGVGRMLGQRRVQYFNLLFDQHEVIDAAGLSVESLLLTRHTAPLVARLGQPQLMSKARAPARPNARNGTPSTTPQVAH